jgi:hypothetical protein
MPSRSVAAFAETYGDTSTEALSQSNRPACPDSNPRPSELEAGVTGGVGRHCKVTDVNACPSAISS